MEPGIVGGVSLLHGVGVMGGPILVAPDRSDGKLSLVFWGWGLNRFAGRPHGGVREETGRLKGDRNIERIHPFMVR